MDVTPLLIFPMNISLQNFTIHSRIWPALGFPSEGSYRKWKYNAILALTMSLYFFSTLMLRTVQDGLQNYLASEFKGGKCNDATEPYCLLLWNLEMFLFFFYIYSRENYHRLIISETRAWHTNVMAVIWIKEEEKQNNT